MKSRTFRHVFGPVPSRRLGRSLGVDLVPFKTCSYDCVYCQLGPTTNKTIKREEFVSTKEVLEDIEQKLAAGVRADYITLSGSGEPTLHSGCGRIIRGIKKLTKTPVAVLTNGSLLWDPSVRRDISSADLVVPSLDAGDAMAFAHVNRPHKDLTFERMMDGLMEFRAMFQGRLWLEVFLLGGLTAMQAEAEKIAVQAQKVRPDRIQLNTVARPPAYDSAKGVPEAEMSRLAVLFGENAEVVADFGGVHEDSVFSVKREDVLDLIERRPVTLDDVSLSLGVHRNEAVKHLDNLLKQGAIETESTAGNLFYIRAKR